MKHVRVPRNRMLACGAVLAAAVLALWFGRAHFAKPNPLLASPELALEALSTRSLYFNGPARGWLLTMRPELLSTEDRDDGSERTRAFIQAVQNPKLFRQLDRQHRFDTLLLAGDSSHYKPLLDHLLETKDWTLSYVDHASMVWTRDGSAAWKPASLEPARRRFASASAKDRAAFLAKTAAKLLAAGRVDEGKQLLDEAIGLDSRSPEAWNGVAIYQMNRGKWREAIEALDRALAEDDEFAPALATRTQVFYATKRFSEAYDLSKKLVEKAPNDPGLLFYHAKIAHEAHAYKAEIEALEKLISLARVQGQPVSGYQIYLGQAYASKGDAQRALDNFTSAMGDSELPAEQRIFAQENIQRIKSRTGL